MKWRVILLSSALLAWAPCNAQVVVQRYDPNGIAIDTNGPLPGTELVLAANVAQINLDVSGWTSSGSFFAPEVVQIR